MNVTLFRFDLMNLTFNSFDLMNVTFINFDLVNVTSGSFDADCGSGGSCRKLDLSGRPLWQSIYCLYCIYWQFYTTPPVGIVLG